MEAEGQSTPNSLSIGSRVEGHAESLFITVSGLIGAGKTTLAGALAKSMGLFAHYEPVGQNIYLEDFYADMRKHGFAMQIWLMNRRFQQHQQVIWGGMGGVQDRSIYEDTVFAKTLNKTEIKGEKVISDRDFATYTQLFANMSNFMRKPNLIVYLDLTPEEAMRRIALRGRECEKSITIEYMRLLHACYQEFIDDISKYIPVIRLDYAKFCDDTDAMVVAIKHEWKNMCQIHEVRVVDTK